VIMLDWRTITPSNDAKRWVRGTELECAIVPGTRSRFAIYSIRTIERDKDGTNYDFEYIVRDAGKISDADVKAGKRPPVTARFATLDEFEAALKRARVDHPEEFENN
jgi:hypothetical protein